MNGILDINFSNEGTTEPVLLADVKVALEIDDTFHDSYITDLISQARQYAEKYLNRSLISRTMQVTLMNQSGGQLLPYGPVADLTALTVADIAGDVLEPELTGSGNYIYLENVSCDPLVVNYSSLGYTSATLPKAIKIGIIQAVVFWFENRGDIQVNVARVAREMQTTLPGVARETMRYERIKDNILFW